MNDAPQWWVGTDESGGIPNPGRPDTKPPAHWRLDMVAATERPRQIELSPDGTTLAFMLDRDTSDVWTVPVAGGPPSRVTTGRPLAAFWEDGNAVWSPDGSRLAFTQDGKVKVVAAAGGLPVDVCEGSGPVWLDDQRLVVGVTRELLTVLTVVDVADAWPRPLATAGADYVTAVVSPDRTEVAYTVFHHDDLSCISLHVVTVATGVSRTLVHHAAMGIHSPVWSPDGQQLAFACELPGWYEVFVVRADGASVRQVTADGADFGQLSFTPDGSALIGVRTRRGIADLVRVDVADGAVAVLAPGGTWSSPRLLPDGSVAAVHESFTTPARLCVVTPDGSVRELFAPTPAAVRAAPHVVPEHVSYRSLDGMEVHGWLYRPAGASGRRRARLSCNPTAGPRRSPATSGTAWRSTSSRRATRGSRSTSAAAPPTAATSSAPTMACGVWPTRTTASPRTTTSPRSAGWTRPASPSSVPATAVTWRCTRWSTTLSAAMPARSRSTATATSSPRGRRATSSAASTWNG
jgi:dipeptidyl aminopeptidase/acylaminoacyl peptidase